MKVLGVPLRGLGSLALASLLVGAALCTPARGETDDWLGAPADLEIAAVFDPPRSEWGPGHRGVDLWLDEGAEVTSPGDGVITFAGDVAGRGVVVILHPSGLRSTLEPVAPSVAMGQDVRRGAVVGTLEAVGSHCAPRECVHWGVRRGEDYIDPLDVLEGFGPIRLLPLRDP
jgi:murein DD-endopeptidase MepM/ murein hydrolase activator NlpD